MVVHSLEKESIGISFYGGEPLLMKNLIYDTVLYSKARYPDRRFSFSLTTNGLLLDEQMCMFAKSFGLLAAISIDGDKNVHDMCRVDLNNLGSHERVVNAARMLLKYKPNAVCMATVNPKTAPWLFDSVKYLYDLGFTYVVLTINHFANWTDEDLAVLKEEYEKIADLYIEKTVKEDKFYFAPFDTKISNYIFNRSNKEICSLGVKHVSVNPEGDLYPCLQLVDRAEYHLGHLDTGVSEEKRRQVQELSKHIAADCDGCALYDRCRNYCSCANISASGFIDKVSPLQCEHERMIIEISDKIARKLYKKKNALFIHKHYNEMYPIISAIEDKLK
ncbi:MAG: radical SAM protein [Clostridiaceae bacterium]|nr:radical SAM protein [Clostridiaceae bacterium]